MNQTIKHHLRQSPIVEGVYRSVVSEPAIESPPEAAIHSLIVPVYKNEASLPATVAVVADIDRHLGGCLEVVFVVDGSRMVPTRSCARL
jgi:hypothetical protein